MKVQYGYFYLVFTLFMTLKGSYGAVECVETPGFLHGDFVQTSIEKDRSTVGLDEVSPVQKKITDFIKGNPELVVTEVLVTSATARIPFYHLEGKKKVIDPKSDEKNLALAESRAVFAVQGLKSLAPIKVKTKVEIAGPDFSPLHLNGRFMTSMTANYDNMVKDYFDQNKKMYEEKAFIKNSKELLNPERFLNFYQVMYKPFHGFRIEISGHKKCAEKNKPLEKSSTTKQ